MSFSHEQRRVILVEADERKRTVLATRLGTQGFMVDAYASASEAALAALGAPPDALVADLWMPGVSGVQLCRLLRSEAATEGTPIILRGAEDTPKERFWADRAGASAYIAKGHIGALSRSLRKAIASAPEHDGFFQVYPKSLDIRDRIGRLLDKALFESVLAGEIRALSTCDNMTHLFDLFSQFLCQVTTYRWLAIVSGEHAALHTHPGLESDAPQEASAALQLDPLVEMKLLIDQDAVKEPSTREAQVRQLHFGATPVGTLALSPSASAEARDDLLDLVARELAGPIRIVSLVHETRRLASHDPLTGIYNRRAFTDAVATEIHRASRLGTPFSLLLFDVDHFKKINDSYGHNNGDRVLSAIGSHLETAIRPYDIPGRWGGEEFVVALPQTSADDAVTIADRLRVELAGLTLLTDEGGSMPITVSVGCATLDYDEDLMSLLNRADVAMYTAKSSGRDRVVQAEPQAARFASELPPMTH